MSSTGFSQVLPVPVGKGFMVGEDGDEPTGKYWNAAFGFSIGLLDGVDVTNPISEIKQELFFKSKKQFFVKTWNLTSSWTPGCHH